MSAGREFQVDGAATAKARRPVRCVCEELPAAEQRKSAEPEVCMDLYQLAEEIRWSGCDLTIILTNASINDS